MVLRRALNSIKTVIYCVVPEALADELFDKLTHYYADDPNVTVIVDRRKADRRERGSVGRAVTRAARSPPAAGAGRAAGLGLTR